MFFLTASVGLLTFAQQKTTGAPKEPKNTAIHLKEEAVEAITGINGLELTVIAILSLFGFVETAYMLRTRVTAKPTFCPIGNPASCSTVLKSKYNTTFGIHNDLLGFLYYTAIVLGSLFLWYGFGPTHLIREALIIIVAGGAVMSLYFTYIQMQILKTWCFWCLTSALTTWLLALFILQNAFFV